MEQIYILKIVKYLLITSNLTELLRVKDSEKLAAQNKVSRQCSLRERTGVFLQQTRPTSSFNLLPEIVITPETPALNSSTDSSQCDLTAIVCKLQTMEFAIRKKLHFYKSKQINLFTELFFCLFHGNILSKMF